VYSLFRSKFRAYDFSSLEELLCFWLTSSTSSSINSEALNDLGREYNDVVDDDDDGSDLPPLPSRSLFWGANDNKSAVGAITYQPYLTSRMRPWPFGVAER